MSRITNTNITKEQKREKFEEIFTNFYKYSSPQLLFISLKNLFFPERTDEAITRDCILYCRHRVSKHPEAGLHKTTTPEEIDRVLKKLI